MNKYMPIPFCLFIFASILGFSQISFQSETYESAKESALTNEQAFFAYFSGNWCATCQIMEETTFQSQAVEMATNDKYKAYKVDFDDPKSEEWKKEFEICCLPTVLIFDEKAQLLKKIEQPLTSTNLAKILDSPDSFYPELEYDRSEKEEEIIFASLQNLEPQKVIEPNFKKEENILKKKTKGELRIIIRKSGTSLEGMLTNEKVAVKSDTSVISEKEKTISTIPKKSIEEKTFDSFKSATSVSYQVQIGYFGSLDNAMKMSESMKFNYKEELKIEEDYKEKKIFYRVLLGNFTQIDGAKKLYKQLKKSGQSASIRKN